MSRIPLHQIRGFMVDLDGTTYLGNTILPGAADFYHSVKARGGKMLYLTNNSSRSSAEYREKLRGLGIPVEDDEVFTSGEATALYLQQKGCRSVYPVGTPSLERLLGESFELTDARPDYVVLGFDTALTYEKIKTACRLLMAGARFVVTHPDVLCPTAEGSIPDAGAMMRMFSAASGVEPETIVGKPNPLMLELALQRLGTEKLDAAMVGDRLNTDIAMASNAGMTSILVFTGEATRDDMAASTLQIDYAFASIADAARLVAGGDVG